MVTALSAAASSCGAEDGIEGRDNDLDPVSAYNNETAQDEVTYVEGSAFVSTCQVSPSPIVGQAFSISASGLPPGSKTVVRIRDVVGTRTVRTTADAGGGVSVTHSTAAPGSASAYVYAGTRSRYVLTSRCAFEVTPPCTPLNCEAAALDCGSTSDGCGGTIDCGDCPADEVCGVGGENLCGPVSCAPASCQGAGAECGTISDGCGGVLDCGGCDTGWLCGAAAANRCGPPPCVPATCQGLGASCGSVSDGCGGLLSCGTCSSPDTCGGAGVANQCGQGSGWPASWTSVEDEVLVLLNNRRAAGATCGTTYMPPVGRLTMNSALRSAARLHSQDMADQSYFSHTSLDGRSPWTRIVDAGWTGGGALAENIAAGQSTPASVVNGWVSSAGHCQNLMSPRFNAIGVGYAYSSTSPYRHYWTTDFGSM